MIMPAISAGSAMFFCAGSTAPRGPEFGFFATGRSRRLVHALGEGADTRTMPDLIDRGPFSALDLHFARFIGRFGGADASGASSWRRRW